MEYFAMDKLIFVKQLAAWGTIIFLLIVAFTAIFPKNKILKEVFKYTLYMYSNLMMFILGYIL